MDRKIVLTKTAKGLMEAAGKTSLVSREVRNVLTLIDGKATIGDLQQKLQLAEAKLNTHLATLMRTGLVREFVVAPASISPQSQLSVHAPSLSMNSLLPPADGAHDAAKQNAEVDAIAREIAAATQAREERPVENPAAVRSAPPLSMSDSSVDPFAAFRVRADMALREAEQRVHAEAEKARVEMRAKAERDAVERSKREIEDKRRAEEEAQRAQRDAIARQQAQAAEERVKREAETQEAARRAEEERQRRAREELDRRASTERALKEAQELAQREAEEKSRSAADAKAQRDAAAKAAEEEAEASSPAFEHKQQKAQEQAARRKAREEERAKAKAQAELAAKARKEERAREIAEAESRAVARVKEREREAALVASRLDDFRHGRRTRLAPRIGLMLLLFAVLAILMVPVLPVDASRYANHAAAKLGVPVKIGNASYALFPLPHLRLTDVQVGDLANITELIAKPQLGSLFSETPILTDLEMRDLQAKPAFIAALLWGRMPESTVLPPQLKFRGLHIEGFQLPMLNGVMLTNTTGRREISFSDESGSLNARIVPQGQEASFELRTKAIQTILPLPWPLEDLNARGLADLQSIRVNSFDAALHDGVLKGNAVLAWQGGWSLEGKLEATQIDARRISGTLEGRLRGTGQFQMRAPDLAEIARTAKLNGSFQIEKGQINGVDLVRSLREANSATGKTSFATLSGQGALDKGKLSLKNITLDGGPFKAEGNAEITPQALSGRLLTEMRTPAGPLRGSFVLGGTPEALKLGR